MQEPVQTTPSAIPAKKKTFPRWIRILAAVMAVILAFELALNSLASVKSYQDAYESELEQAAYESMTQGITYGDESSLERAMQYLEILLDRNPKSAEAYATRGTIYIAKADYEKALENLEQAIRLYGENAPAELLLQTGSVYLLQDNTEKALPLIQRAVECDETLANGWLLLGQLAFEEENYTEALADMEKCLEQDPKNASALAVKAACLSYAGQEDAAMELLEEAAKYADGSPQIRESLAGIYLDSGDYDKAAEQYELVLKDEPDSTDIRQRLGACYMQLGEYTKATVEFQVAWDSMDSSARLTEDGKNLEFSLASALVQCGEYEKAKPLLEDLQDAEQYASLAKIQLALCYAQLPEEAEKSLSLFEEALEESDPQSEQFSEIAMTAADVTLENEDYEDCIRIATSALEKNDSLYGLKLYRGIAYLQQGKAGTAITDLTDTLQNEESGITYYYRAIAYISQNQAEKATGDLQKVMELSQENPELQEAAQELLNQLDG